MKPKNNGEMIHGIIETILALAVAGLAVLLCAQRKRMAKTEQYFNSALILHNRRMWAVYKLLRWHVKQETGRKGRANADNAVKKIDEAFNGVEQ